MNKGKEHMKTLIQYFQSDSVYWGKRGNWLVVAVMHRDSDALARSNFRSFISVLSGYLSKEQGGTGSQDITSELAIEEASHWAVGWIEYLIISPEAKQLIEQAGNLLEKLESYPVLNEEDFSNLEQEDADTIWRDCYRPKERLEYVRDHRNQFEFRGFSDMLACLRGKYFSGYASELLN